MTSIQWVYLGIAVDIWVIWIWHMHHKRPRTPDPKYHEIPWKPSEKPEQYAARVLDELLPTFKNRDEALDALTLCFPHASEWNLLAKIGAAVYFTRNTQREVDKMLAGLEKL